MRLPPMPWLLLAAGALGGAVMGFVLGLHYLPTLAFAVVEGAVLIGVPASLFGVALVGLWAAGRGIRRRLRH